jgi:hypothetical protein
MHRGAVNDKAAYDASQPPFATMSDTVVAPDGRTYQMSDLAARQQAADASTVVYANQAIDAIHEVDPQMMVTMGLFTYRAVRRSPNGFAQHCSGECDGEWRYAFRPAWSSNIGHAAAGVRELQVQSCAQGFSGWIYWTWDTDEDANQRKFFTLTEGGGPINGALAPIVRSDPCRR